MNERFGGHFSTLLPTNCILWLYKAGSDSKQINNFVMFLKQPSLILEGKTSTINSVLPLPTSIYLDLMFTLQRKSIEIWIAPLCCIWPSPRVPLRKLILNLCWDRITTSRENEKFADNVKNEEEQRIRSTIKNNVRCTELVIMSKKTISLIIFCAHFFSLH